jgi:hypothetical protein
MREMDLEQRRTEDEDEGRSLFRGSRLIDRMFLRPGTELVEIGTPVQTTCIIVLYVTVNLLAFLYVPTVQHLQSQHGRSKVWLSTCTLSNGG